MASTPNLTIQETLKLNYPNLLPNDPETQHATKRFLKWECGCYNVDNGFPKSLRGNDRALIQLYMIRLELGILPEWMVKTLRYSDYKVAQEIPDFLTLKISIEEIQDQLTPEEYYATTAFPYPYEYTAE
jgi:hypothetical protein